jgi:hypothetical protein
MLTHRFLVPRQLPTCREGPSRFCCTEDGREEEEKEPEI